MEAIVTVVAMSTWVMFFAAVLALVLSLREESEE